MILITGWTGNTGSLVLERLLRRVPPESIVGVTRKSQPVNPYGIRQVTADLGNESDTEALFTRYRFGWIIHIANIRYSPVLMRLAEEHKVPRVILVHTTGVYSKYNEYSAKYKEIEANIVSGAYAHTSYTILRPTMIYGNARDHNMHKLIRFLAKYPVFPVFGDGSSLMQPVHVEDLADAVLLAYGSEGARNQDYDISGGSVVSYHEVIRTITGYLKKRVRLLHIPIPLAVWTAKLLAGVLKKKSPIKEEQVRRLQEDKVYSHQKAREQLGYDPRPFDKGIMEEIRILRQKGMIS